MYIYTHTEQVDMHMVVTRLGCKSGMVVTWRAKNLALAAWTGLENACRGFISGREGCLGSEHRCLMTKGADYCMLVNEWARLRSRVCLLRLEAGSGLGFSFGVRAWTEMEIQCVKGMYRTKLVSSENKSGLIIIINELIWSAIQYSISYNTILS